MRNLTSPNTLAIAAAYEAGESVDSLAARFNLSPRTLRCAYLPQMRAAGLVTRRDRPGKQAEPWPTERDRALAADYEAGEDRAVLMERYGIKTRRSLAERLVRLRKLGLVTRNDKPSADVAKMSAIAEAYNAGTPAKELMRRFGYSSMNSMNVRLNTLRRMGLITRPARHGNPSSPALQERHERIVELWRTGMKRSDIAERLGTSRFAVDRSIHIARSRAALEASLEGALEGGLE